MSNDYKLEKSYHHHEVVYSYLNKGLQSLVGGDTGDIMKLGGKQ